MPVSCFLPGSVHTGISPAGRQGLQEGRRHRMYEKALDACATSPYASGIERWVLAGEMQAMIIRC